MSTEEKESIMALPLAERVIAVALKHVFDEIRKIDDEEIKETQQIHQSFIGKFKEGELNVIIYLFRLVK